MFIAIKTYANLRRHIGEEIHHLDMKEGATVVDALTRLVDQFGNQISRYISGDRVVILLNGKNVKGMKGKMTPLESGDMITVLPVLSGG